MVFLEKGRVSEGPGGADATLSELVTYVRRAKAVPRQSAVIAEKRKSRYPHPTHPYFVPGEPYLAFTASTHLGTASAAKSWCLFFHAS